VEQLDLERRSWNYAISELHMAIELPAEGLSLDELVAIIAKEHKQLKRCRSTGRHRQKG
jgi:hypothetical protein